MIGTSGTGDAQPAGLRARKRRETLQRITAAALRLFVANGFEATTLDAIAAEAGISRRTFFYYFKSKDDVLLSLQGGLGDMLAAALAAAPPGAGPLPAVRRAIVESSAAYPREQMIVLDRLMRSSEAVQMRKQASYVQHERTLFAALVRLWPDPARAPALRLLAMLSIGVIRLSLDLWSAEGGTRPLADLIEDAFDALEAEFAGGGGG